MPSTGWILYCVAFALLLLWIWMRRSGQAPARQAQELVKQGALIVDVRSVHEFERGHLSQAFNMPLDQVTELLPEKVKDREQPILLHCQSGMRSKQAKDRLVRIGYTNVHNLGSYERAFKIVSGRNL